MSVGTTSTGILPGHGAHRAPRRRADALRTLLLWAVLLAFAWQAIVTQTHRHFDAIQQLAMWAPTAVADDGSRTDSPFDSPANCPVCRETAHAGPLLLPPAITIALVAPVSFRAAAIVARPLARLEPSHNWRSRAPPEPLQA
ncbi:hypothetical protein ACG3SL_00890 [Sphingomonas sp. CJ20]